jgi:hypothetical protein
MSLKSFSPEEHVIDVSVKFYRIGEIDIMNEKFLAEFKLYISWEDDEVIDEYDPKKHWNPQIVIENAFTKSEEQVEYRLTKFADKTGVLETRHIKVNNYCWPVFDGSFNSSVYKGYFWERMELQDFPFDAQELSITLISKIKDSSLRIVAKEFGLHHNAKFTFLEQQRYELLSLVEHSHVASYDFGSRKLLTAFQSIKEESKLEKLMVNRPRLNVKVFVVRRPMYYVLNAFFLILLITLSSLSFFSINCKLPQNRLQSTGTTLLTSISLKWVTNRACIGIV